MQRQIRVWVATGDRVFRWATLGRPPIAPGRLEHLCYDISGQKGSTCSDRRQLAVHAYQSDFNYDLLDQPRYGNDFRDVKGQEHVKRALEVAAAGGHCVLV